MQTYKIVVPEDSIRESQVIEFEAEDAGEALIIAHREATERNAELWRDNQRLCTIRRDPSDLWKLKNIGEMR